MWNQRPRGLVSSLLERIDQMAEVKNLLLDQLNIRNGSEGLAPVSLQEASPYANCSIFDHIKLDCRVMTIQGQACLDKVHQEDRLNRDDLIIRVHTLTIIIPLFSIILCKIDDLGGPTINPILHHTMVSNNINNPTQIKGSRHSSRRRNRKLTRKPHARPHRHPIRSSAQSRN